MRKNRTRILAAAAVTVAALGILGYSASISTTVAQVSGGEVGAGTFPADHAKHHRTGNAYSSTPAVTRPVGAMMPYMVPQMAAQMSNSDMSAMMKDGDMSTRMAQMTQQMTGIDMQAHMVQMAPMMKGIDMQTHMTQMTSMMKDADMQVHMAQMAPVMNRMPDSPKSGQ